MHFFSKIILAIGIIGSLLLAGCSKYMASEGSAPNGSVIDYSYLCGCVWVVADSSGNVDGLPYDITGADKAIYFVSATEKMFVLQRYIKDQSSSEAKPVYRHIGEYSYSIDYATGIITIAGDNSEYYLHADRLNDRNMTLCVDSDCEQYVAYTRTHSVEIED